MREFRQLATDVIHESPTNPRRSFSESSLDELTASVRRHGVLQPILVRPNGDGFVLIAGARRLRAAKLAGCETVPARVLDLDDAAADEATIIENLHRENIHPLDEGVIYQRLVSAGRTIEDVAAALGKSTQDAEAHIALGPRHAAHRQSRGRRDRGSPRAAAQCVRASRSAFSGSPRRRQGSSLRFDPLRGLRP